MKKLGSLKINPEKLIKNEELLILRGGYDTWTWCYKDGIMCANNPTGDCAYIALEFCDTYCPGWNSIICFP